MKTLLQSKYLRDALAVGLAACLAGAGLVRAATALDLTDISFVRIAQSGDDPPGITGPLTGFDIEQFGVANLANAPAVDEFGRVVFVGRDFPANTTTPNSGVFMGSGSALSTVADRSLDPPGITQSLTGFSQPAITAYGPVFRGSDAAFRSVIVAKPSNAFIRSIAQYGNPVVGASPNVFNSVDDPHMSGPYISFTGNYPAGVANQAGLFIGRTFEADVSLVPDLFPVVLSGDDPPGPVGPIDPVSFSGFDSQAIRGVEAAFVAQDANFNNGIFIGSYTVTVPFRPARRTFKTVISQGDPLPNGGGAFTHGSSLSYDGRNVLFTAQGAPSFQWGIYNKDMASGTLTKIVQQGEAAPDPIGVFDDWLGSAQISDGGFYVIYARNDANHNAVMVKSGNNLRKVIGTGDILQGKQVSLVSFGPSGVSNNSLAFGVEFTDGSQAIYRADLTLR